MKNKSIKQSKRIVLMALVLGVLMIITSCGNHKVIIETKDVTEESNNYSTFQIESEENIENTQLNINPLVSSDISELCKNIGLTNYGDASSNLITEKILVTYDNIGNITKCSNNTDKANNQTYANTSNNISNLSMYTEYGKNELGYNTVSHLDFIGSWSEFEKIKTYIIKVANEEVYNYIKDIDTPENNESIHTLNFKNGIIKIVKNSLAREGYKSVKIDVYYNLDILSEEYIDTVKLSGYEQILNYSTFKDLKNFTGVSKINDEKVLSFETYTDDNNKYKINSILISRDWVNNKDNVLEYSIYNVNKQYNLIKDNKNYTLSYGIDNYDRFNIKRLKNICVGAESLAEGQELIKLVSEITENDIMQLDNGTKRELSNNESVSISKSDVADTDIVWYIAYALYNK